MIRLALALLLAGQTISGVAPDSTLREGEVVFQRSQSRQSEAVAIATHSQITHCGILVRVGSSLQVLEAVQPVKVTPLKSWIARGAGIRLTTPELLGSFNLSDRRLRSILQKRYGGKPPLTDSVVSPKALHASSQALRVAGNTKF